jgi:methionine-rich copper-binding protein CopC
MTRRALLLAGLALVPAACAPRAAAIEDRSASILASSRPAAGSTVAASVDELVLNFSPPARLDEVTVAGPSGTMPMMVHAIGETTNYSLPLSGLEPGSYQVRWRASSQGREYRGAFQFSVRG